MTIDLDAIEAKAKAATPNVWIVAETPENYPGPFIAARSGAHIIGIHDMTATREDLDFIAALNPSVALELVAMARGLVETRVELERISALGANDIGIEWSKAIERAERAEAIVELVRQTVYDSKPNDFRAALAAYDAARGLPQ